MTQRIALIGTAGRRDDGPRLTRPVWEEMLRHAASAVDKIRAEGDPEVVLVSGGAAYADHLAVRLFLDGKADGLELHLPAALADHGFVEAGGDRRSDAGAVANHYHRAFRERTGVDGLADLHAAAAAGAVLDASVPGFKQRNSVVAGKADHLIAYTFGHGTRIVALEDPAEDGYGDPKAAGLRDGGTADTWSKARRARRKVHVPMHLLEQRARQRARQTSVDGAGRTESGQPGPDAAPAPSQPARRPARSAGDTAPVLEATMYFTYGRSRRPEIESGSTFEAILAGERTSTTRFDSWRGTDRWRRLRPGQRVRFFEDKDKSGRAVDVTVREVREVDLASISDADLEAWSKAEGWSLAAGRDFGAKNGAGVQVIYDSPQPVAGRTRTRESAQAAERSRAQAPNAPAVGPAAQQGRLDLPPEAQQVAGTARDAGTPETADRAQGAPGGHAARPGETKPARAGEAPEDDTATPRHEKDRDPGAENRPRDSAATNSPVADAGAIPRGAEPTLQSEETQTMAETQTAQNETQGLSPEARDRRHLEGLAQHALAVHEAAEAEGLNRALAQDEALQPMHRQLATLRESLADARLIPVENVNQIDTRGRDADQRAAEIAELTRKRDLARDRWERSGHADNQLERLERASVELERATAAEAEIPDMLPALPAREAELGRLEDVGHELMTTLEEASEPGVPARLSAAGAGQVVAALNDAEPALAAFDYATPNSAELSETAQADTPARRVTRDQLERVVQQSLEFLDRADQLGVSFENGPAAAEHQVLIDSLAQADYLLPGESTARTEPLAQQAIRGTDAQLLAIADASGRFAGALDQDALSQVVLQNGDNQVNAQLTRIALADESNRLKDTLSAVGYDQTAVDPEAMGPAVVVGRPKSYTFLLVDREMIPDLPATADETVARGRLGEMTDGQLMALVSTEPLEAYTHGEALAGLDQRLAASNRRRDQVVVMGTGNADLPLALFDEADKAYRNGGDPDQVAPNPERGRKGLTQRQADAVAGMLEAGIQIMDRGQFDTRDHNSVRYPTGLLTELKQASQLASESHAEDALLRIARGETRASGISAEGARDLSDAVTALSEVQALSTPLSLQDTVVPQDTMDRMIRTVDTTLQTGLAGKVAEIGERRDTGRMQLDSGVSASSAQSLADSMADGRTPSMDELVGSGHRGAHDLNRATPEMTRAKYETLKDSEKRRCRAFVMEPGKGWFADYHTTSASFIQEVPAWRQARLDRHLSDLMVKPDGTPDWRAVTAFASLALDDRGKKGAFPGRAIVAPKLDEARVIRRHSERCLEMLQAKQAREQQAFRAKLPKAEVGFDAEQLSRSVRQLEASGSEKPAVLVKRGASLALEHPDARTVTSAPVADQHVQKMRDGHRLSLVDAPKLRAALEAAGDSKQVRLNLEAERLAEAEPRRVKPTGGAKAPARREDDLAI